MAEQGNQEGGRALAEAIDTATRIATAIEPMRGRVSPAQLEPLRTAFEAIAAARARGEVAALTGGAADRLEATIAALYARGAAIAAAAGDELEAERWLAQAERLTRDDASRAELAAGRLAPERHRALVHGRVLLADGRDRAAHKLWRELARGDDAIARAAAAELSAPRPLQPGDAMPSLWTINGCGKRFYGRYARRPDGSHATVHSVCFAYVPIWPLGAWRVRDQGGFSHLLAREPLPRWLAVARWIPLALIAAAIAIGLTVDYLHSPRRLAAQRWDAAIEAAQHGDAEAALQRLDDEMQRDAVLVDSDRSERAGAEVVRLAVGRVPSPFTTAALDQATRVIGRYQGLPDAARSGAAQRTILSALDAWIHALGDTAATAEPRLALLAAEMAIADVGRKAEIEAQIAAVRLAAAAQQADAPLDALAILVDHAGDGAGAADHKKLIAAADAVVARLAESPALLLDAGVDLDAWLTASGDATARARVAELRKQAQAARAEAEADGVTPAQLAALVARRPWDQFAVLQLARGEASAGKLDAAAARIEHLGPPGLTIRDARLLRAQIAAAQGKLDVADGLLAGLVTGRLSRFAAASRALNEAGERAEKAIQDRLRISDVPADLRTKVDAAASDEARGDLIQAWARDEIMRDAGVAAARTRYEALGSVVPIALEAGSVKLRRAQALSGAARSAMLEDAERTFLAIRSEAEGQTSFRLALGEIYARLGKTAESETEFKALLDKHDLELSLQVSGVYRELGSVARAKQIAKDVYTAAKSPTKESAAHLLAVMTADNEAESESWYRRSDLTLPPIRAALLELEGARLDRLGKPAECEAKYAEAARTTLSGAVPNSVSYNNAALAYERGYDCSGDAKALRDAEAALERSYRASPDEAIVIENLASVLRINGEARVLGRHINLRALRLRIMSAGEVWQALLEGPERDALLAELAADPSIRRSGELLTQVEVLSPNSATVYGLLFSAAERRGDTAAAAAVVERARGVKGLDHARDDAARARWASGADDTMRLAELDSTRIRLEAVLGGPGAAKLDAPTRAAGGYALARALGLLGIYRNEPALLAQARAAAAPLWPALDPHGLIASTLIDEAALAGDAKAWIPVRRLRSAATALDKLVADHHPLAAKIRGAASWAEIARQAAADASKPRVNELRLARLIGDPALEARARAVLDDKLARLTLELDALLAPGDEAARADLAYLDGH